MWITVFTLTLGALSCSPSADGQCSCPDLVKAPIYYLVAADYHLELPHPTVKPTRQLSDLPTTVEITLGTAGSVCSVKFLATPDPDLISGIEDALRHWKFKPIYRHPHGKTRQPVCARSKVLLYATKQGTRVGWDIPQITDYKDPK